MRKCIIAVNLTTINIISELNYSKTKMSEMISL